MAETEYKNLANDMILRDYLAVDRTLLAARRTYLSYCRTALGLLTAGLALIKVVDGDGWVVLGYFFMALTPITFAVGLGNYIKVRRKLKDLEY